MKTKRITLSIPTYSSIIFENASFEEVRHKLHTFLMETYQGASTNINSRRSSLSRIGRKFPKFKFNKEKIVRILLPVFGVAVLGAIVWAAISPREGTLAVQGTQISLPKPIASQELNKTYTFPVKEGDEELTNFSYTIENAELRRQIIVKGQRATAVEGRMFLVMDIKLVNDFDRPLSINTRDYVRVVLDGNEKELLAPDIHNDPVEVQAISTKPTRIGLSIDENVKSIELRVGEIDGEKETIKLDLSK